MTQVSLFTTQNPIEKFDVVYKTAMEHGIFFGVTIPSPRRIQHESWSVLHQREQRYAQNLHGIRKMTYVGGRIAGRLALQTIQQEHLDIEMDPFGAPFVRAPISISIAHKNEFAIALISKRRHTSIGVDVEQMQPERLGIASKVLTAKEMEIWQGLPQERQWNYLLLTFSLKESIFKALAPKWKRYIGFMEAEVYPQTNHYAHITLTPEQHDILPVHIEGRFFWYEQYLVTSVQATWN